MEKNRLEGLKITPKFPGNVYTNLPDILEQCTKNFTDDRERDVVLTSCLVILSGCFSNCKGKYGNDWIGPTLYGFIVSPPASGKGSMKYAKLLGKTIQNDFQTANLKAVETYDAKTKTWNKLIKKSKEEAGEPPKKPKCPVHFIPGNSSAASIYNLLSESDGKGTICETEADTLAGAIKQDWGNFSHLLRSAFHHEDLTMSRSTNNVYTTIEHPRLSTLLTGTPDQVPRLIASAEDGLCSRFIFYCFSKEIEWQDPTPCSTCTDLRAFFEGLSQKVAKIKKQIDSGKHTFRLTDEQFGLLNTNFKVKLERVKAFEGSGAASAVYRLGLIAFRIAMIFTILRNVKNLKTNIDLVCSDQDFENTMSLIDVYFEHSMVMYSLLPKQSKGIDNPKLGQFHSKLPLGVKISRKKANELGKEIGISEKTVGNYLTELKTMNKVECPSYGMYQVSNIT